MSHAIKYACLAMLVLFGCACYGQSEELGESHLTRLPSKLFDRIQSKTAALDKQLTSQTQKYLQKMARQEQRLQKKLSAVDSNGSKQLFAGMPERYEALAQRLKTDTGSGVAGLSGEYRPFTDSLRGTLAFLRQHQELLSGVKGPAQIADLGAATGQLQALQAKLQDASRIDEFLQQRKAQISQYLSKYTQLPSGVSSTFNSYKKNLVYYRQQVNEYKDILDDPDKMLRTALVVLNKFPAFTSFMKSNSALSGIFSMPGTIGPGVPAPGTANPAAPVATGLMTRDQVLSNLQSQLGTNGPNAAAISQQNIGSAQGQVDELRSKLGSGSGGDVDMPNFKPNSQKTKSFLKRLQLGTNLQTTHSDFYFPTTTDIGLSLGYKIDDNNIVGLGASYKIGWGSDMNHIKIGSQGAGLRSFLDVRVRKTWFATGGFEYNYQLPFSSIKPLQDLSHWQKSGLIGVSKVISMKTRVFKNTKLQLLWDFLSYQQIPKTQPFLFRLGYGF